MDTHPAPPPPAPGAIAHAGPVRWTPDRQRLFLTGLLATGNVTQAARAVGMSPASAHRLRRRLAGTPFDRTWSNALALHAQSLADPFNADPFNADPFAADPTRSKPRSTPSPVTPQARR